MYMTQRQVRRRNEHKELVWQNDSDVCAATLEQLLCLREIGSTVYEDADDRDVLILMGPSKGVRHLIISETVRQSSTLYFMMSRQ